MQWLQFSQNIYIYLYIYTGISVHDSFSQSVLAVLVCSVEASLIMFYDTLSNSRRNHVI